MVPESRATTSILCLMRHVFRLFLCVTQIQEGNDSIIEIDTVAERD